VQLVPSVREVQAFEVWIVQGNGRLRPFWAEPTGPRSAVQVTSLRQLDAFLRRLRPAPAWGWASSCRSPVRRRPMDQHERAYKKWLNKKRWAILNRQRVAFSKALRALTPEGRAKKARASRRRMSSVQAACNDLTDQQWEEILAEQRHKCAYCGRKFSRHLPPTRDHIVPVSQGGGLTRSNVRAACLPCNSSKGDRNAPSPFHLHLSVRLRDAEDGRQAETGQEQAI
jgi:5-methylcytosine-specific restriction endonuclease McrA